MKLFRDPVPSSINRRANLLEQELKSWWQLPSCTSKKFNYCQKMYVIFRRKKSTQTLFDAYVELDGVRSLHIKCYLAVLQSKVCSLKEFAKNF